MLTDEEIALGGYRYEDLLALRIVTNRTDLDRKQTELKFPLPVKTGKSQAWFPKAEVHKWLRERAALRATPPADDQQASPRRAAELNTA
jgi:predicted DNA-binding transcriptional regulator AlpA